MSFTSVLSFLVLGHTLVAQIPGATSQASPPAAQQPTDPLERTTPRGTISAFVRAVERDDYVLAARYLQVTESQRRSTRPLARNLKALIDRGPREFTVPAEDNDACLICDAHGDGGRAHQA